jgi:hypothetical protein
MPLPPPALEKASMSMGPCVLKVQWHLVALFNELVPYQCLPCSGITITCILHAFLVYQYADTMQTWSAIWCQTIEKEQPPTISHGSLLLADTAVVCLEVRVLVCVPVQRTSLPSGSDGLELVQFGALRLPVKSQSSLNLIPSQWGGFPRVSVLGLSVSVSHLSVSW